MPLPKWAHLMGLSKRAAEGDDDEEKGKKAKGRKAQDDDDKDPDAENDDPEGNDDDNDPDAENDDPEGGDDDKDPDDDDDKARKAKKAKSRKADEGDDDEADAKVAKGRRIERARIEKIFSCQAAGIRPDMAASLAFGTSLSASEAIAQLKLAASAGAPSRNGRMSLDERMQGHNYRVGKDAQSKSAGTKTNPQSNAMLNLYNNHLGGRNDR